VFGKPLIDQPMMRAVLADMALDLEGAVALVMRLCRAFDRAAEDAQEAAYARLLTPATKYWICKTAPAFIYEAMECLGGNGYVEESMLPRLYREAPVNAIWEGSGNVMCLDVLRALKGEAEAAVVSDLRREIGVSLPRAADSDEASARQFVGKLALMASAQTLKASAPEVVGDAFIRTRLMHSHGALYGAATLDAQTAQLLLKRVLPET
jgi:putative acyl-CoA dehydrogenase